MIESLNRQNGLLLSELGSNPRYAWMHSSKLYLSMQKMENVCGVPTPQYNYFANPKTGLVELKPVYVKFPMLPLYQNHYVLCRFTPSDQEQIFKARFGTLVEYPADGIWQPLDAWIMKPGLVPTMEDSRDAVIAVRKMREEIAQRLATAEDDQTKRENKDAKRFGEMAADATTAFGQIPGKKGEVSFFNAKPTESVDIKKVSIQ